VRLARRAATWSVVALSVGVGAALYVAVPVLVSELDIVSSKYGSIDQARAHGAIDQGWLPPFTPASAREIAEIHDLDTNERCAYMAIDPGEGSSFLAALHAAGFRPHHGDLPALPEFSLLRSCPFLPSDASAAGGSYRRAVPNSAEYEYVAIDPRGAVFVFSALR
jgi:hypothetical protein